MSLSISQGLQTCLEPRLVEPIVLRLKLGPPIPPVNTNIVAGATISGGNEMGSWSFLLSPNNANSQHNKQDMTEKDRVYVHPLDNRSASKLSAESLAMCTESLGSESGGDNISILSLENFQPSIGFKAKKQSQSRRDVNFPPPLSSGGVRVRPRREGGRLVLEAVRVSTAETNFRAERSNGRLRLHLLADQETEDESHETEQETGDFEPEIWGRGMEGNCGNVGGKMGIGNVEGARSRCKNWERHCGGGGWLLKPICLS